ncbi:MAG TPA: hypothetical protein VJY35_08285 [Candidatus Eisenbacteria bacterium]|nr:hypothetical protein [Candidatus Eisenbacteria bacterium]
MALSLVLLGAAPADSATARIERLIAALDEYPVDMARANDAVTQLGGMRDHAPEIIPLLLVRAEENRIQDNAMRDLRIVAAFDTLARPFAPQLLRIADAKDPFMAGLALEALSASGHDSPELRAMLRRKLKEDSQRAGDALDAIGSLGPRGSEFLPVLIATLDRDPYYGTRMQAAKTLGRIGDDSPPVLASLKRAICSSFEATGLVGSQNARYYHNVRYAAARALANLGPAGARVLFEGIRDAGRGVDTQGAFACADLMGSTGESGRAYVPELIALMASPDEATRGAAEGALRKLGAMARPALLDQLGSADPAYRRRITKLIEGIASDSTDAANWPRPR